MNAKKQLVIVAGAKGSVGRALLTEWSKQPQVQCIGLSRSRIESPLPDVMYANPVDLLHAADARRTIKEIDIRFFSSIIYIHSVGRFSFEIDGTPLHDNDGDGIDDEVLKTNVDTFLNVAGPLEDRIHDEALLGHSISLTFVAFGSVSDAFHIPYWQSYTKAKDILRDNMKRIVESAQAHVNALFVNVSTINTDSEHQLRPYADKTYWLTPQEVARFVIYATHEENPAWREVDLYKPNPAFHRDEYLDPPRLLVRWKKEMGLG